MSVSPFEHPFLSGLLGDEEIAALFSAEADLKEMIRFEVALAEAEAEVGLISKEAAAAIVSGLAGFRPDVAGLKAGTARDGVVVPELVRQMREAVGQAHASSVHLGATSQDAIDTSLAIRLGAVNRILAGRLDALVAALEGLDSRDGAIVVMAHTRMQAAIPVPASRKIRSWREPLARHRQRLDPLRQDMLLLQLGGAAGTPDKLGVFAEAVTRGVARRLGLEAPLRARHTERDGIAGYASWLSLVTGSLGKIGQDITLAAQTEVGEIKLGSGGGSSAMPHKVNPVQAEALVALARFNATLLSGMHQALVHENERSGAAWTLEWMLLPQMTVATGAALRIAAELVGNITFLQRRSG